jgi:hypothetical protein
VTALTSSPASRLEKTVTKALRALPCVTLGAVTPSKLLYTHFRQGRYRVTVKEQESAFDALGAFHALGTASNVNTSNTAKSDFMQSNYTARGMTRTVTARDGEPFATRLEQDRGAWSVAIEGETFAARVPLTAHIAALLAKKASQGVTA